MEQWDFVGQWIWQIIGRLPPTLMPVLGTWWLFQWNCSTQQDMAAFHGCSRYEGISCFLSDVGKNLSNNCKLGQGHSSGSTDGWKTWKRWNIALDLEASNYTKNPSLWQPLCNTVMRWTMCVCSIFSNPFWTDECLIYGVASIVSFVFCLFLFHFASFDFNFCVFIFCLILQYL